MPKKCPRCNSDNSLRAAACWQCYHDISAGLPEPVVATAAATAAAVTGFVSTGELPPLEMPAATTTTSAKPARAPLAPAAGAKKKLPLVPIVIVLLIAAAVGGVVVMKGRGGDPKAVVTSLLEANKKDDYEGMKQVLTTSSAALVDAEKAAKEAMAAKGVTQKIDSFNITAVTAAGEETTVTASITASISMGGQSKSITVTQKMAVVKEGGQLKVDSLKHKQENDAAALAALRQMMGR